MHNWFFENVKVNKKIKKKKKKKIFIQRFYCKNIHQHLSPSIANTIICIVMVHLCYIVHMDCFSWLDWFPLNKNQMVFQLRPPFSNIITFYHIHCGDLLSVSFIQLFTIYTNWITNWKFIWTLVISNFLYFDVFASLLPLFHFDQYITDICILSSH